MAVELSFFYTIISPTSSPQSIVIGKNLLMALNRLLHGALFSHTFPKSMNDVDVIKIHVSGISYLGRAKYVVLPIINTCMHIKYIFLSIIIIYYTLICEISRLKNILNWWKFINILTNILVD